MVTGRTKGLTFRGKGNVVLIAAQLDDVDGNPTEEYVLLRADEFGRLRTVDAGAVATFLGLTDTPASYVGQGLQVVRVNAGETALEFAIAGGHSAMMPQMDDLGATTWGIPGWGFDDIGTDSIDADRLLYIPIYVERSRTFTQIGIHVTAAGAGGRVARLGIYSAQFNGSGDLTPDTLTLDAGTVSIAAIGEKSIAIAETLAEGFHFLAISTNDTFTFAAPNSVRAVWGPITGRTTSINADQNSIFSATVVDGAAAFPDPATAPDTLESVGKMGVFIGE